MDIYATSYSSAPTTNLGKEGLRQQAEELEAVFLNTLVSEMFKGVDKDSQTGGSFATETWRSMQSEQFAGAIARTGGVGIADQIMTSLMNIQEQANPGA